MLNTKKYIYRLIGNFKNYTRLRNLSEEISGVVDAELDEKTGTLTLSIDEQASEYDVFCALNEIAESLSIDVDYADSEEEKEQVADQPSVQEEAQPETEEDKPAVPAAPIYEKKVLPEDQKPWKSRYLSNFVEMGLSLVLILIASIFDISGNVGMIMYLLAFAVVAYEIIWDAVSAVIKKDFFNYNISIVVALVVSLFVTSYREAAVAALIFEAVLVLGNVAKNITSSKIKSRLYYNYNVINQGEDDEAVQVFAHEVEVGTRLNMKEGELIPFDCKIESGEGVFDSFNITGNHGRVKKVAGEIVNGGEILVSGTVDVVVKKSVEQSFAGRLYAKMTAKSEKADAKTSKLAKNIMIIGLAVGVIVCFVAPVFELSSLEYGEGLRKWAYVAIMLVAASSTFAFTVANVILKKSGLNLALSMKSFVLDPDRFEQMSEADNVVFHEPNALSGGTYKIVKTTAMPAFKGQVSNIVNSLGVSMDVLLVGKYEASVNGKKIVVGDYETLSVTCASIKKLALEGAVRYVLVDGEFAGTVSITSGLKQNAVGVVRELRDAGVKSVVVTDSKAELADVDKYVEFAESAKDVDINSSVWVGGEAPDVVVADVVFADVVDAVDSGSAVVVADDDVKPVAKIIKLAKRQTKKAKQNLALFVAIKAVALAIGVVVALLTSVPSFWIVVALACVADLVCILNAFLNSVDVY